MWERLVFIVFKDFYVVLFFFIYGVGNIFYLIVKDWIVNLLKIEVGEKYNSIFDYEVVCLLEFNLCRIKCIFEGGSWEFWLDELILECYCNYKGYIDVYGCLSWDKLVSGLIICCISYLNGCFGYLI